MQNVVVILQDIHSLLKNAPNPDPRTWLNRKAADLYFNGGQEEKEEYKRTVRRFAQRSMEEDGVNSLKAPICCVLVTSTSLIVVSTLMLARFFSLQVRGDQHTAFSTYLIIFLFIVRWILELKDLVIYISYFDRSLSGKIAA